MRAVLGDEKLTYLGYSYGTYLGAVYAELFPEKVGRMVLDGAVDPLVGDLDALATQMAGFESAYRAFLEFCFDSGECPFSGSVESAMQQTETLILSVDGKGMESDDGRTLDAATVGTGLINNLYSESSWGSLVFMLADLKSGDAQATFDAADSYNNRYSGGFYDGNGYDIYTAVTCNEGIPRHRRRHAARRPRDHRPAGPVPRLRDGARRLRRPRRDLFELAVPGRRDADLVRGGGCSADHGGRHDQRPGNAVRAGRLARRAASRAASSSPTRARVTRSTRRASRVSTTPSTPTS